MSIGLFRVGMADTVGPLLAEVLAERRDGSRYIGQGPMVELLEVELAAALGLAEPPVTVNSGTSALTLACHMAGGRPGAEIVTTPMTCVATTAAIMATGATPVWADVDPTTGMLDPASAAAARSDRTVAAMVVDWGGAYPDFDALRAALPGLPLIEDAAHTFGPLPLARGDYTAWSFQAIKFLTTGDGGALRVPAGAGDRARRLRWFGLDRTSTADFRAAQRIGEIGFKMHMNDIAAAIGLGNVALALEHLEAQRLNGRFLTEMLVGAPGIAVPARSTPYDCYWIATALVGNRASFQRHMAQRGIETSPVHERNDAHPGAARASGPWRVPCPGLDAFAAAEVALPCGWWLTERDMERVATAAWTWEGTA